MPSKQRFKTAALVLFLCLAAWRAAGYPNFMNAYAVDPRSKPELRQNCAVCHAPEGRKTDPNFLNLFGQEFKANQNRITPEMRERFTDLFYPADRPIAGTPADTVKFSTEQVVVNVTVMDHKGNYVTGLDREAFTLKEDDREQQVLEFLGEETPIAVAVLLDLSGSALPKELERAANAVRDFATRLNPTDTFALYTFGEGGVQMLRDYSNNLRDLKPLLKQLKGRGDTPLYDAVLKATEDLRSRPERRRVIVLLSDGGDSASQASLREAERDTFRAGVTVYSVDLVNTDKAARRSPERQASAQVLRQLAEETGGRYITAEGGFFKDGYFFIRSRTKLKKIFDDLIDELHRQYTITYEPANQRRAGRWRTIRVEMEQADLNARTRLGYREGVQ
jgi:Ca-activated chloride channel homolog